MNVSNANDYIYKPYIGITHQSRVEKGLIEKFRDVSGNKFLELLRIMTEVEGQIDLLPIMNLNKNSCHGFHAPKS